MTSVLVSGSPLHVSRFAVALRTKRADVIEVTELADMPTICAEAGPDAFEAYIQLPSTFLMRGATAIDRVHHFYANGVLARFTALQAALSTLRTGASVIFVLGALPPEVASRDDLVARESLTKVLAQAARADAPQAGLSVRVLGSDTTPDEIVGAVLGVPSSRQLVDELSDLDYADWRVEVLGLAALDT